MDTRTILLLTVFSQTGLAFGMVLVAATQRVYAGFKLWAAFFVTLPLIFVFLALKGSQPLFFSTVLINVLNFGGIIALMEGTRAFIGDERSSPLKLNLAIAALGLAGVSWFTFVNPSVSGRLVFHSGTNCFLCLHVALRPLFGAKKPPKAFYIHTTTFTIFGLFEVVRVWRALETNFADITLEGWSFHAMLILIQLLNVFTMMGCLMMTNERSLNEVGAARRSLSTLLSNLRGVAYRVRIVGEEEFIEYASEGAEALSGFPQSAFTGMPVSEFRKLIDHADNESNRLVVLRALTENRNYAVTYRLTDAAGRVHWVWDQGVGILDEKGELACREGFITDITERVEAEAENARLVGELRQALNEVKTLSGLIPICASCKKIRDDKGYWNNLEMYISEHTGADFTHGICPDCVERLYPHK